MSIHDSIRSIENQNNCWAAIVGDQLTFTASPGGFQLTPVLSVRPAGSSAAVAEDGSVTIDVPGRYTIGTQHGSARYLAFAAEVFTETQLRHLIVGGGSRRKREALQQLISYHGALLDGTATTIIPAANWSHILTSDELRACEQARREESIRG